MGLAFVRTVRVAPAVRQSRPRVGAETGEDCARQADQDFRCATCTRAETFPTMLRSLLFSAADAGRCPVIHKDDAPTASTAAAASGCPVMHGDAAKPQGSSAAAASGCPVVGTGAQSTSSNPMLNPLNRMPAAAQQQRGVDQAGELSKERVESTIPKGDGSNWVYPSAQMFYNALVKKGKGQDVDESSMDSVIAIHNNMNEKTWRQVLEWEDMHCDSCSAARKLTRFVGRPDELSPKAAVKYYLGLAPKPFDRHDWTVDRCGTEVRYIIDYYDVADKQHEDRLPSLHDDDAVRSIWCDVRPAGDTPWQLVDRARVLLPSLVGGLSSLAASASTAKEPAAEVAAASAGGPAEMVRTSCAERMAALQACDSDATCAQAHIGLMMCIAQHVCAAEADAFAALAKGGGATDAREAGKRFDAVEACVSKWGAQQEAQAAAA